MGFGHRSFFVWIFNIGRGRGYGGEKVEVIVYIRTEPGKALEILERVKQLSGTKFAAATTGRFDIVVRVEVPDVEGIGKSVVGDIQNIPGVRYTETSLIVAK